MCSIFTWVLLWNEPKILDNNINKHKSLVKDNENVIFPKREK